MSPHWCTGTWWADVCRMWTEGAGGSNPARALRRYLRLGSARWGHMRRVHYSLWAHIEQAIAIISWHLFETRRIFSIQSEKEEILEAQRLLDWLIAHDKKHTTPREIQQFSPIRDKQARDEAIELLANHNYIRVNKQNQKTVVELSPYAMNG